MAASPTSPDAQDPARLPSETAAGTKPADRHIGPYRLCELIGEGGFGDVWRAEQTEVVQREVALKIIKTGMDTAQVLARFDLERQALASLEHPNIATLLNAGVSAAGKPWFAMELVRGGPVTHWCEARKATIPERLWLFLQICRAVQHAHDKGILHRDLKPNNILMAESTGMPKVIDFGVAVALDVSSLDRLTRLTQGDQVVGTPLYMSPEQLEGHRDLDVRSDVYALGVLLYELLTGLLPFDITSQGAAGIEAVKQLMLETVPERPSTRVRRKTVALSRTAIRPRPQASAVSADLDWITLRALEKDRVRRYGSVAELAADVERHLAGERVLARPPSVAYAAGRWFRRHRTRCIATAAGSVIAAATLGPPLVARRAQSGLPGPMRAAADGFFTNSLGMKFAPLPGTDAFICIHETRRQDYATYAERVPTVSDRWKNPGVSTPQGPRHPCGDQDGHPVVMVSWEEARFFCTWLSTQEGRTYRLPTDAEWSIAVGLAEDRPPGAAPAALSDKDTTHFPWGGDYPPVTTDLPGNYADTVCHDWFPDVPSLKGFSDGYVTSSPVMSFKPNALRLYDMGGNVSEWCEDWYDAAQKKRVVRGSYFLSSQREEMLSSHRNAGEPDRRMNGVGFRCILEKRTPAFRAVFTPPPPPPPPVKYRPPDPLPRAKFPAPLPADEVARRSFTNSLGMKFVPVPSCPVLVCIHETRRQDYAAFAREVPESGAGTAWRSASKYGLPCGAGDDHPVCAVTWDEASRFCKWLSRKEGRTYRLPKDWEWSIAVGLGEVEQPNTRMVPQQKGDTGRCEFPFGDRFPPPSQQRAGNYADATLHARQPDAAWIDGYDDGQPTTAPVMSYAPNAFGLYDMGGNVSEWVQDWLNWVGTDHVLRGGSWMDAGERSLYSANRQPAKPDARQPSMGFRVVLEEP